MWLLSMAIQADGVFVGDCRYVPLSTVATFRNRPGVLAVAAEALRKEELLDAKDRLRKNKSRLNTSKRTSEYSLATLRNLADDSTEKAKSTPKKKTQK